MDILFPGSKYFVRISAQRFDSNNMPRSHKHTDYELYYLTEGERYLFVKDRFYTAQAGDIFLIAPGTEHRTLDSSRLAYRRITCNISPALIPQGSAPEQELYFVRPDSRTAEALQKEADAIYSDASPLVQFAAAMKMLSILLTQPEYRKEQAKVSPTLEKIAEILNYLETHYTSDINLIALSEQFFISEYYLCRLFKEYTGRTILGFVTELRIQHARKLLLDTTLQIHTIAVESGFGSVSAFTSAFRRSMGCSPRDYRRQIRGE